MTKSLQIHLAFASEMPETMGGHNVTDPFVKFTTDADSCRFDTQKNAGANATWEQTKTLKWKGGDKLTVEIRQDNKMSRDECIGKQDFMLSNLFDHSIPGGRQYQGRLVLTAGKHVSHNPVLNVTITSSE